MQEDEYSLSKHLKTTGWDILMNTDTTGSIFIHLLYT